ncbi:hypothetical protein [Vulgatibacter incomptus]|uniref:Lipoprotein n=1 Tax=Vulgatibacter incomptus TaxID=1391653 RepID=A0A0K1PD66_9BACT|nr:hypothetical protein [Vulgatibacter incomptus]AKU91064.1 hypothetical protein AKJ08_1451 [Vulgatibacter incomptus]
MFVRSPARLAVLPAFLLFFAFLAACGEDLGFGGDRLDADPLYFSAQRFYCPPRGPSCPPFACDVDPSGRVGNCDPGCAADNSTAFQYMGQDRSALCVPERCTVRAQGAAPVCDFDRCADDHITTYVFEFSCP